MPACVDDWEQGTVTVGDEGAVRVLHHPCARDNVVLSLRLMVPGNIIADGDDVVLWKVVAVYVSDEFLFSVKVENLSQQQQNAALVRELVKSAVGDA